MAVVARDISSAAPADSDDHVAVATVVGMILGIREFCRIKFAVVCGTQISHSLSLWHCLHVSATAEKAQAVTAASRSRTAAPETPSILY